MVWRKIFLVSLALVTVLTLGGCRRRVPPPVAPPEESKSEETTSSAAASGLPTDLLGLTARLIEENKAATRFISQLRADLELVIVAMSFVDSFAEIGGLSTNYYIYSTPQDPKFYYLASLPRDGTSPKRFLMPKEDFEFEFPVSAIPLADWKVNYGQAIAAVEKQDGEAWRSQHKLFKATVTLAMPVAQKLAWYITYRASDGSGATFKATVDATNGETLILGR